MVLLEMCMVIETEIERCIQVLYSGILWPRPARLHQRWGSNEAEISFQICALAGV